jgi:hypothetical protein
MEEEDKIPDPEAMKAANPVSTTQSAGEETERREIPIARNANPAGVSTARTVADLPMEAVQGQSESATGTTASAASEPSKAEYPIARNANPTGVSTARTRD